METSKQWTTVAGTAENTDDKDLCLTIGFILQWSSICLNMNGIHNEIRNYTILNSENLHNLMETFLSCSSKWHDTRLTQYRVMKSKVNELKFKIETYSKSELFIRENRFECFHWILGISFGKKIIKCHFASNRSN